MQNPFRYFNNSLEVIRLAVMMHIRYPLSLRQVCGRHLNRREISKQNRSAALAEWRQLSA
jgi:transposase-like protein